MSECGSKPDQRVTTHDGHNYDVLLCDSWFCDLVFTGLTVLPQVGTEIFAPQFSMVPGGTFTAAVALRRLGLRVGWSCDFGNDDFSQFVLKALQREDIDGTHFRFHEANVRRVTVSLSYPHDRAFVTFVDALPSVPIVPLISRHRPRVVLLNGLRYGPELAQLVAAARAAGSRVYMDCQSHNLTLATEGVIDALQMVDIFAPNAAEALQLTGAATIDEALAQLAELTPTVILKLGRDGAIARQGSTVIHVPIIPVSTVDTTSAGDCFNTGFLYGYLRGAGLQSCVRYGNISAGLKTTAVGIEATPTAEQLEGWLSHFLS
ncbi:MAG: carbohydrate kinase family protein [Herpetosiphon sp.]